ncbi:MAG: hypothetical protein GWN01_15725 [Nitrosopumilaceae archaeon]|nr:aminopeptidase 1 [Nitrosopumilaceae archaeon]NIU88743.1 hypothetical protein [Nitrosopumilaceae archaeon]NIV66878.1 hypothetical protein [Nitrosopumilaceae archaeon]NIX62892.1 hypothetical protein [Nitrosopumilaceae archaeon]
MNDIDFWQEVTGQPLLLGTKVRVCKNSPYYHDHAGIDFYITGLFFKRDGRSVDITIGEEPYLQESDGWTINDIELVKE